jgi:hypothetical protein
MACGHRLRTFALMRKAMWWRTARDDILTFCRWKAICHSRACRIVYNDWLRTLVVSIVTDSNLSRSLHNIEGDSSCRNDHLMTGCAVQVRVFSRTACRLPYRLQIVSTTDCALLGGTAPRHAVVLSAPVPQRDRGVGDWEI